MPSADEVKRHTYSPDPIVCNQAPLGLLLVYFSLSAAVLEECRVLLASIPAQASCC